MIGLVAVVMSFFVSDRYEGEKESREKQQGNAFSKAASEADKSAFKQEIDEMIDSELSIKSQAYVSAAGEQMAKTMDDKIMGIDEYSSQILDRIQKNHEEVVFLYDMLQKKEEEIKNDINMADRAKAKIEDAYADGYEKMHKDLLDMKKISIAFFKMEQRIKNRPDGIASVEADLERNSAGADEKGSMPSGIFAAGSQERVQQGSRSELDRRSPKISIALNTGSAAGSDNANASSVKYGRGNADASSADNGRGNADASSVNNGRGNANASSADNGRVNTDASPVKYGRGSANASSVNNGRGKQKKHRNKHVDDADRLAYQENMSPDNNLESIPKQKGKTPVHVIDYSKVKPVEKVLPTSSDINVMDYRDDIMDMHKKGRSVEEISRMLGLGQGEVGLVIRMNS
ncbi:MAG: DUF6115 domain-containing protein [Lachnospiraceae bacterium]|nr:DUF6115 domain-containing protein [Lachnospiraceae bacterium]